MIVKNIQFDAHCHIFSLRYLLLDASNMLWDLIIRRYPRKELMGIEIFDKTRESRIDKIINLIKWLGQMVEAAVGSEESNFNLARSALKKYSEERSEVAIVPLMMDIYYMFAHPVQKGRSEYDGELFNALSLDSIDINESMDTMVEYLQKAEINSEHIKFISETFHNQYSDHMIYKRSSVDYVESAGFKYHVDKIRELKIKYNTAVYPFFAVDPRRAGVIDSIINNKVVGKGKIFNGVKIYPRLGYDPACEALMPLYSWCEKNSIPITTHCSAGGFPPFGAFHDEFGHPNSFKPVLEKFPRLVLNFAHFGSSNKEWADAIVALMDNYKNVFTDLSCYTKIDRIKSFKSDYWDKQIIRDRVMFGTDFNVFYFTKVGSNLDDYYKNFNHVFNIDELGQLKSMNPLRFLSGIL